LNVWNDWNRPVLTPRIAVDQLLWKQLDLIAAKRALRVHVEDAL
jgi:hypothetical protein